MNNIKTKIAVLSLFYLFILSSTRAQYNIGLEIPSFPNDTLLFGHYFTESLVLKDTFLTNSAGKARITGKEPLPAGMYTIFFPNKRRFDLLIDKDQQFEVITDTLNLLDRTRIKGSKENELFYQYLSFLDVKREESETLQARMQNSSGKSDSIAAKKRMEEINLEVKKYVQDIIDNNPGMFLSKFLVALKDINVPDPPKDANGNILDPSFQVKYYKQHYFDHFDLTDVRLLRSPLYQPKIKAYVENWIYPHPDSIFREVDWLIEKSRSDTLLFKYMLTTLFNYYANSKYVGMDAVYTYIGSKYYIPEAKWSSPEFIQKLKERVEKLEPLLIGKVSPDIEMVRVSDDHFRAAEGDTSLKRNPYVGDFFKLHDLNADYIVLYFWEPDCGHCKKTIPELYELWQEFKGIPVKMEVIAVNMLGGVEGKEKWVNFIDQHQIYGWINAWNPYDFSYKEAYDVTSSNILYLLDKDKKIIAKRIAPGQVKEIIAHQN